MNRVPSLVLKELLILLRDRGGLLTIFLMPLAILIVVTLVQDGAFRKVGSVTTRIELRDEDHSTLSKAITDDLSRAEGIQLCTDASQGPRCQATITIPAGTEREALAAAGAWTQHALADPAKRPASVPRTPLRLRCRFDPSLPAPHRRLIMTALTMAAQGREFELLMRAWSRGLVSQLAPQEEDAPAFRDPPYSPGVSLAAAAEDQDPASGEERAEGLLPDMIRFNVPAYAVFAMFFIVIPVSNCLLRERTDGTLLRLLTMPVRPSALILAKLLVFLAVALLQFALMLAAGAWLLPVLGTGAFHPEAGALVLLTLTLCSGLAAIGFALAVASTAGTQEQAGMTGAAGVVILAALGGVMVPVQYMPPVMRQLSSLTPLNWAVTAYQDACARGAGLGDLAGRLLLLLAFGLAGCAWAWSRLFRRA